jgi:gamma-glutamylputrescine oxidase
MPHNFSIWEKDVFVQACDVLIIGSGIVGLNAAIELKEQDPAIDVLLVDRGILPSGASTKNAGFACFGSVSELTDDLSLQDEDTVARTLIMRWNGLEKLRSIVGDSTMDYQASGGVEVFENPDDFRLFAEKSQKLNSWVESLIGLKQTYQIKEEIPAICGYNHLHGAIVNQHEGVLHPGKMIRFLAEKASKLGVRFLFGTEIDRLEEDQEETRCYIGDYPLRARYVLLATNGFTTRFYKELDLKPARNLVLLTDELKKPLSMQAGFHLNAGYVYWRSLGNKLLIGGGRHLDPEGECTSEFGKPELIYKYLLELLKTKILPEQDFTIEHSWSGIMGIGSAKRPIIQMHADRIGLAVRMGGMGVAIGSLVGIEAARMIQSRI